MAQNAYSAVGAGIVLPLSANFQGQFTVKSIEIDNGTAATLQVGPDSGGVFTTVPAYQTRIYSGIVWSGYQIVNQFGTTIQATDVLNIIVSDQANTNNQASSYGPAAWGGGAVPNLLVPVLGGQQFLAWQVQQLIALLTGIMTGQQVVIAGPANTNILAGLFVGGSIGLSQPGVLLSVSGGTPQVTATRFGFGHPALDLRLSGDGGGLIDFNSPAVAGHTTDPALQLPIKVQGVNYWLPLRT